MEITTENINISLKESYPTVPTVIPKSCDQVWVDQSWQTGAIPVSTVNLNIAIH